MGLAFNLGNTTRGSKQRDRKSGWSLFLLNFANKVGAIRLLTPTITHKIALRPSHGKVIGTICSFHRKPRRFAPEEVRTAEMFAERAATAIDNYHLYLQQRQFNEVLEAEVAKRTEELRIAQISLVERERLAAIGEFAATIVHEIRNPLTTIMLGLNYLKRVNLSEPAQERFSLTLDEATRLERLLCELLLYAKPQVLQITELDINELIGEMLNVVRSMPEALGRKIEFFPTPTVVVVRGDKDRLKQVFINIVRNACEAVAEGDTVTWAIDNAFLSL